MEKEERERDREHCCFASFAQYGHDEVSKFGTSTLCPVRCMFVFISVYNILDLKIRFPLKLMQT